MRRGDDFDEIKRENRGLIRAGNESSLRRVAPSRESE
jgi:hypothetical protein